MAHAVGTFRLWLQAARPHLPAWLAVQADAVMQAATEHQYVPFLVDFVAEAYRTALEA